MAYSFNGTSDVVSLPSVPVSNVPLSMSVWFNPTASSSIQALLVVGIDAARYQIRTGSAAGASSNICAQAVDLGSSPSAVSSNTFTAGAWNFAGAVFASHTLRTVNLNGTAVTSTASDSVATATTKTSVGASFVLPGPVPAGFYAGKIAEAGVWNVALTADEMAALSQGVSPRLIRPSALVFYAPLAGSPVNLPGGVLTVTGAAVSTLAPPKRGF